MINSYNSLFFIIFNSVSLMKRKITNFFSNKQIHSLAIFFSIVYFISVVIISCISIFENDYIYIFLTSKKIDNSKLNDSLYY